MVVASVLVGVLLGAGAPLAADSSCRGRDRHAEFIPNVALHVVTSTDPNVVRSREETHIPVVPPDTIELVTDERVCAAAARAYAGYHPRAPPSAFSWPVYLVRVGRVYLVVGPGVKTGEWGTLVVLSDRFAVLSSWLH